MKWVEVIELRTAEINPAFVAQTVTNLIREFGEVGGMEAIKLYRDALLENDASIHLHWKSERVERQGSATGLCMVHLLKKFGLVSHCVWVETEQGDADRLSG